MRDRPNGWYVYLLTNDDQWHPALWFPDREGVERGRNKMRAMGFTCMIMQGPKPRTMK